MSVFSEEESALLDQIAIEVELDRLDHLSRTLIEFRFAYTIPDDYAGPWPPEYVDTGKYVGKLYRGRAISATRVQNHTTRILAKWRRRLEHNTHLPLRKAA